MTTPTSLITEEMLSQIGVITKRRTSFPITASDIRRWAVAVYWPETPPAQYWDEEVARASRFGGLVAPEEMNPFAWPADSQANNYNNVQLTSSRGGVRLFGGTDTTYVTPMRVGDVITAVSSLLRIDERPGKNGPMLFFVTENRWTNQDGDVVKIELYTVIET